MTNEEQETEPEDDPGTIVAGPTRGSSVRVWYVTIRETLLLALLWVGLPILAGHTSRRHYGARRRNGGQR